MINNLKKYFYVIIVFLFSVNTSFATNLPVNVIKFLKSNDPQISIRFDGLITFSDGAVYLPLFPAMEEKVDKIEVSYTYPQKTTYPKMPQVIVLNSNFAMLKLLKAQNLKMTVANYDDIPIAVKTGILPQDLLVPKGLILPETLSGILGNLVIPTAEKVGLEKESKTAKTTKNAPKNHQRVSKTQILRPIDTLKNKLYFVSNFNSNRISVYTSNSPDSLYYLKLDSIPKDIKAVHNNKFLLVATANKTYLDVVDVYNEKIIKQIDLAVEPNQILISPKTDTIYIISTKEKTIFTLNLKELKLKEMIRVKGEPQKAILSFDEKELFYIDRQTSDIYNLKFVKDEAPINEFVFNAQNISKLLATQDTIYAIIRTKNILMPFELETKLEKPIITVSQKPVDMIKFNDKIFILGAQNAELSVYNTKTLSIEKTIKLGINGFCNTISKVDNSNIAIITSANANKYAVFDFEQEKVLQTMPIDSPISSILVINKQQQVQEKL